MVDHRNDDTDENAPPTLREAPASAPIDSSPQTTCDSDERGASAEPGAAAPPAPSSPIASLYVAIAILFTSSMLAIGFIAGRSSVSTEPTTAMQADATRDQRAAMAQRNEVWRVLNDLDNAAPDSQEKTVGMIVGAMLDPDSDVRELGMRLFAIKSVKSFPEGEVAELERVMIQGTPDEVAGAFARIAAADKKSDELIVSVFADKERIGRYLRHALPIPLEKMPDGSTP